ncbi:MAG: alpha-2-macroglobulin, partial [Luteolibacter sp.]
ESSWPHTTAVVVHGLLAAKANGAKIPERMLNSGIGWLMAHERKQVAALQLHVEREALRKEGKKIKDDNRYEKSTCDALDAFVRVVLGEAERDSVPMLAFLYRDRVGLPVYAQCLLGLEEHRTGDEARRDEVMKMISQFLKRDAENQTVYLDLQNSNFWWNWYGSEVEAHAWYLKLLAAVKPQDPDTRGLVKYLVNNRKHASYWESTRDTAFAIEAIASYFKASGEDAPEMEVDVLLDGKSLRKVSINRENLFTFDGTVTLTGDEVTTGKHDIELKKSGKGTLYANAFLEVFTLEDKLRAAGLEVKVQRRISKLIALEKETEVPDSTGLIAKQQVERFRREPLVDGAKLASGDRVEVELILESKNDYEYLIFSDAKAAGFEALDALSGYVGGGGLNAYMEPRDQTVDFFIRTLPRGTHTLRYQLRAEAPGIYKALPAVAEAMYAPELRANSEDFRLEILK